MTKAFLRKQVLADNQEVTIWTDGTATVKFDYTTKRDGVRRVTRTYGPGHIKLLGDGDGNTKLRKNAKKGVKSFGLSLAPNTVAGVMNTCPWASRGCIQGCLNHQGMGSWADNVATSRIGKTILLALDPEWFVEQLCAEIERKCSDPDTQYVIRLNVFSDIAWEKYNVIQRFPHVEFYDYTKAPHRAGQILPNYWVTFSRSESNDDAAVEVLARGDNVAIAFAAENYVTNKSKYQSLPKTWNGFDVIDGDETDLRFDDDRGVVVGLRLKAHSYEQRQKSIESGFPVLVQIGE